MRKEIFVELSNVNMSRWGRWIPIFGDTRFADSFPIQLTSAALLHHQKKINTLIIRQKHSIVVLPSYFVNTPLNLFIMSSQKQIMESLSLALASGGLTWGSPPSQATAFPFFFVTIRRDRKRKGRLVWGNYFRAPRGSSGGEKHEEESSLVLWRYCTAVWYLSRYGFMDGWTATAAEKRRPESI